MLTGYIWARWAAEEMKALERLADYGLAHSWQMGEPASQIEVYMGDNLAGILCRMIGRKCSVLPAAYFPVTADYERHLQVLGILLQGETTLGALAVLDIDGVMLDRLKENAAAFPKDGLFAGALAIYTGDYTRAIELLTNPAYECPTYVRGSANYCLVHKAFAMWLVLKHHGGSDASAQ
jgi:hypothetical protein